MIRTRGIQLPKLALYQAELRPDPSKVAIPKGFGNRSPLTEPGQIGPNVSEESRIFHEVGSGGFVVRGRLG